MLKYIDTWSLYGLMVDDYVQSNKSHWVLNPLQYYIIMSDTLL